ncbi:unnamed protein product, partial [Linum tenue]
SSVRGGGSSTTLTQSYTPIRGSANRVTLLTLYFMHAMGRSEHTIELGYVLARTFTKACAGQDHHLVCGPVITALARYYRFDTTGMTMVRAATPFSEATLRHQHMLVREGRLAWIAGLPRPPAPEPAGDDQQDSSAAGGRWVPRRPVRRALAPASPSSIADQLAAIAQQNERILAGQESIHPRLDRERDRGRRLMSGQHYIMSYLGLDPNSVHYPFVPSLGYEDEYPPTHRRWWRCALVICALDWSPFQSPAIDWSAFQSPFLIFISR